MKHTIFGDRCVKAGAKAVSLDLGYRGFMIKNASENTVYFREKDADGKDAAPDRGMRLDPYETFPAVLCAKTLSLIADGEDSDVRLLLMEAEA